MTKQTNNQKHSEITDRVQRNVRFIQPRFTSLRIDVVFRIVFLTGVEVFCGLAKSRKLLLEQDRGTIGFATYITYLRR